MPWWQGPTNTLCQHTGRKNTVSLQDLVAVHKTGIETVHGHNFYKENFLQTIRRSENSNTIGVGPLSFVR